MAEYPLYRTSLKEDLLLAGGSALLGMAAGWLFFRHPLGLLTAVPAAWLTLRTGRHKTERRKREEATEELRDYLLAVIALLRAGYALENAMEGAEKEMITMHGENSVMAQEAGRISDRLRLRQPPETLWRELGERCSLKDATQLSRIFTVTKRQGGETLPVLNRVVRHMEAVRLLKSEIGTSLSSQKLEFHIMCLIPAGMLVYMDLSMPEMTAVLYSGGGRLIMAAVLILYTAGVLLGDRILEKSYE